MAALVNSHMYDYAPSLIAAHRKRGDEIVGHGRTNAERQGTLDEAAERALIGEATARLTEAEGRAPEGWLGPWISHSHADARPAGRGRLQIPARLVHGRPAGLVQMPRRPAHPRRALSAGAERHPRDRRAQGDRRELRRHDRRPVRRDARAVGEAAAGDGRRAARLHRRPAAPPAPPQARLAPHRPAPRRRLAHDARRDRACCGLPRTCLFPVPLPRERRGEGATHIVCNPPHPASPPSGGEDEERQSMRLFTATLATETNTFSPLPTSLETYEESRLLPARRASDRCAAHVHRAAVRRPRRAPRRRLQADRGQLLRRQPRRHNQPRRLRDHARRDPGPARGGAAGRRRAARPARRHGGARLRRRRRRHHRARAARSSGRSA